MCGICGVLTPTAVGPDELRRVAAMTRDLRHRGPDASGEWSDGPVALGHRRLAIIDLSPEGNQPLLNEDGTAAIVVNGEIYNFLELRRELEAKGHRFRSRSDSEVILHLYEEEGPGCVARLRGMFAFALWDARARRLTLARDRRGEKPLCWARRGGQLWFASEIGALERALPWRPELDLGAIDQYLTLQYVPAPLTVFEGVHKLPAAHVLTVEPGGEPRLERYWRLSFAAAPGRETFADAVEETRAIVDEAVEAREVSDVPLGAFLSGGVDSSTIVALMARRSSRPIRTFSIDFPSGDGGEGHYARMVADRFRTEHHSLVVDPNMVSVLPQIVELYGEPFADPSAVPTWYVSRLAREHVIVALSGDGGDEAFGGYGRYGLDEGARALGALPWPLPPLVFGALARAPGAALRPLRELARHQGLSPAERYLCLLAHFTRLDKAQLVGPLLREHAARNETTRDFERVLAASDAREPLHRLLDLDGLTYLPDDIFFKVDIASMAHALEVRAPFADHLLLERLARFPAAFKMRRFRGKQLLRHAVRGLVPEPILTRRKRGFGLPLGRWMREDLSAMSRELLTDRTARERGLFEPAGIARLLAEHRAGVDHGERLWNLTVLELWLRAHARTPARPSEGGR